VLIFIFSPQPPTRIVTKDEIRFMQKLKKLEEFKKSQQEKDATMKVADDGSKGDGSLTLPSISEASPVKGRKMANSVMNPSQLWSQPQELFSHHFSTPNAFSGESMLSGFRKGLFDKEALSTLRKVARQPDKIAAYEHLHDSLLLRSYSMSTSVEIPKGNQFSHAEVLFGDQNGMYKNAAAVIKSREKPSSSSTALGVIAKARLEQSAAKIGPMTHVIKHGAQVLKEVSVPKDDKKEGDFYSNKTEDQLMQIRLLQSKELAMSTGRLPRPLDMEQLADLTVKVEAALDLGSDYERLRLKSKNRKKGKSTISLASKNVLERKLMQAIKDIHRPNDQPYSTSDKKVTLTNKMLLPFYKVEDVRHYMDIFSAVDMDFSGDLDVHEWVKLFTSMDKSQSAHQARMIFMQLNKSGDGVLTSKDLIPIIFNKANKEQMALIMLYVDSEIIQKRNDEHCLNHAEVAQLFECYDVDAIGFVPVETIRDRIRAMQLPEAAHFAFMDSIAKMEEDEMLNEQEFNRVLRLYTVR
jgi:Ca2+-binding EF-hand superfamily protein